MTVTSSEPLVADSWQIDTEHSEIRFTVRHLVIAHVSGRAARWRGVLIVDEAHPRLSSVEIEIDADSIDTGASERDAHLHSSEFLDAARYPHILFKSKAVKPVDAADFLIVGDLTIHAICKEVTLYCLNEGRVRDPLGQACIAFSAHTTIDRRDFGLVWNQPLAAGGVVVGDKVEVTIKLEAIRRALPL